MAVVNFLVISLFLAAVSTQLSPAAQAAEPPASSVPGVPVSRTRPHATLASYVGPNDYLGIQGYLRFELSVSPRGRVTSWRVLQSSGSARLDHKACNIMVERARFIPARDAEGTRVADTYQGSMRWYER
jgi:periplasmic protein TonB